MARGVQRRHHVLQHRQTWKRRMFWKVRETPFFAITYWGFPTYFRPGNRISPESAR